MIHNSEIVAAILAHAQVTQAPKVDVNEFMKSTSHNHDLSD